MNGLKSVELSSGQTLWTRDENLRSATGTGPILLCVHGFPFDHSMWRFQSAEALGAERLIAPDLRGFGANPPLGADDNHADGLSMRQFADDLDHLLTALQIDQPIFLCGLSMGGYIAWQFWMHYRHRVAGLILCDTRAAADTEEVKSGRHYLADRVLREGPRETSVEMLQKVFAKQHLDANQDFVQAMLEVMTRTHPKTIAAALRGMAARPDVRDQLTEIDCPSLLMCGVEDKITPPDEMQAMSAAMPRATFVEIPAAGHMSPLENAARVNQAIAQFLKLEA